MDSFFTKKICSNSEVIETLTHYLDEFPGLKSSAIRLARYLVYTKNYEQFISAVRNRQVAIREYDENLADYFPIMIFAFASPLAYEKNSRAGIPEDITLQTLRDINVWIDNFRLATGRWGLSEYFWLVKHYSGNLFQIGLFQYELYPFPDWAYIFEHHSTGEQVVLAPDSEVTATGHIIGSSGEDDCLFSTAFKIKNHAFQGCLIDTQKGIVQNKRIELPLDDWNLILQPGDLTLFVHIRQGEKMDKRACLDSMEQVKKFYYQYFPEIKPAAFISKSWLLDPNLVNILHENSNIVKFMHLFHKVPVYERVPMILERVFGIGTEMKNIKDAPENTTLQKNLKTYLLQGGKVYTTGGYIPIRF
jgi:hypothetical protein